jgi:hypothetical protein
MRPAEIIPDSFFEKLKKLGDWGNGAVYETLSMHLDFLRTLPAYLTRRTRKVCLVIFEWLLLQAVHPYWVGFYHTAPPYTHHFRYPRVLCGRDWGRKHPRCSNWTRTVVFPASVSLCFAGYGLLLPWGVWVDDSFQDFSSIDWYLPLAEMAVAIWSVLSGIPYLSKRVLDEDELSALVTIAQF